MAFQTKIEQSSTSYRIVKVWDETITYWRIEQHVPKVTRNGGWLSFLKQYATLEEAEADYAKSAK